MKRYGYREVCRLEEPLSLVENPPDKKNTPKPEDNNAKTDTAPEVPVDQQAQEDAAEVREKSGGYD